MATPLPIRAPELPSKQLRRVQESLRALVREDQDALAVSVGEGVHRIVGQLDRLAGLQELFEWWHELPM